MKIRLLIELSRIPILGVFFSGDTVVYRSANTEIGQVGEGSSL